MKKIALILSLIVLVGCTCLGQIPPIKYVVADPVNCQAIVPDIVTYVTATAPCSEVVSITQSPTAGAAFISETILTVFAITDQGIESTKDVLLVPINSDSAEITIDQEFFAYTDPEVFEMIDVANTWAYNYPARFLTACDSTGQLSYMEWKTVAIQPYMEDSVFWYSDIRTNDFYEYVRATYLNE